MSTSSSDIGFYSLYVKNDVTLCKLDGERRSLVAPTSLNLSRNSLKEKVLLNRVKVGFFGTLSAKYLLLMKY